MRLPLLVLALLLLALPAGADSPEQRRGTRALANAAGRYCLHFAYSQQDLRAALVESGMPALPADKTALLLQGKPGLGYNGSWDGVRVVVLSADDGACTVLAGPVVERWVWNGLENQLRYGSREFRLWGDSTEAGPPAYRHRSYRWAGGARLFLVRISTPVGDASLPASISVARFSAE